MKLFFSTFLASSLLLGTLAAQNAAESEAINKFDEAGDHYFEAKDLIQARYRKELAVALGKADKVEVYLLDFDALKPVSDDPFARGSNLEEDEFPILPYHDKTKILKKATLTPAQRAELLPALQKTLGAEIKGGGALCHFPIHGVRVFSGEKVLFETSFCWHCGNFYLHYPDGAFWLEIANADDLSTIFEKLMPVPQSETDRFDAKYGPDRNKEKAEGDKKNGTRDEGKKTDKKETKGK